MFLTLIAAYNTDDGGCRCVFSALGQPDAGTKSWSSVMHLLTGLRQTDGNLTQMKFEWYAAEGAVAPRFISWSDGKSG